MQQSRTYEFLTTSSAGHLGRVLDGRCVLFVEPTPVCIKWPARRLDAIRQAANCLVSTIRNARSHRSYPMPYRYPLTVWVETSLPHEIWNTE